MLRLLELHPGTGGRLTVDHDQAGHLVLVATDDAGLVGVVLDLEPHEVGQLVSVASLWLGVQRATTVQPLNSRPGRRAGAKVAGEASTRVDRGESSAPRAAS